MVVELNNESDVQDDGDDEDADNCESKKQGMAGMADIINKILEKPISNNKQDGILSKSKKSKKRKTEIKEKILEKKKKIEERTLVKEKCHVIPTRSNAQREILLKKIATKGVVKLFNAVNAHQKTMSEKMKDANTESKKEKAATSASKSTFMDLLTKKSQVSDNVDNANTNTPSKWQVLRDDFMLDASMKDWDKEDNKKTSNESDEICQFDSDNEC
ncbi:RRP15-like protein isoform X2 [Hydra vulgaris]|uniref:RRP15-like protein n=1 Tax=Hydra vulgaris TaxID=6087 RepID=A0ABM4BE17_HYDVU